jgi:hypothetical protein
MTATISGSATSTLVALTTTGNTILGDASTDTLNVGNGGLVKDASGNVGIGTASPTVKFEVAGFAKGAIVHRAGSYTSGATTPSVANITTMSIANSSPTSITNFTDAEQGQVIYLVFQDSNTTITRNNAYLSGGTNFTSTSNDTLTLLKSGLNWYEVSRSINA